MKKYNIHFIFAHVYFLNFDSLFLSFNLSLNEERNILFKGNKNKYLNELSANLAIQLRRSTMIF